MNQKREELLARALDLHRRSIVIDSHGDTTQRLADPDWKFESRDTHGHVDLPRIREGAIDAMVFAVFAPPRDQPGSMVMAARAQIDRIKSLTDRLADRVALSRTADDVRAAKQAGRFAVIPAIEGGHLIEDSLDVLREYRRAGAVYLTLTHAGHTNWADSAGVHEAQLPKHGGLTSFGREVVAEMERIGLIIDVSHVSDATFWQVIELAKGPVIASHSSCRAVHNHRRNLTDQMMRAIARTGGVVQINFASLFVDPFHPPIGLDAIRRCQAENGLLLQPVCDYRSPLRCLVDHFEHAIRTVGYEHVGIGSDFDGVPALPEGMNDCSHLPNLTAALLERGHRESDLTLVLGENFLGVLDRVNRGAG